MSILSIALVAGSAFSVVVLKNVVMGKFEPVIRPLWSPYVWFNEVINGAHESVAAPLLGPLLGTPFVAGYLRLIGCKVGKHAFVETTLLGEFDLVEIGDYVALNPDVVIQNHLFTADLPDPRQEHEDVAGLFAQRQVEIAQQRAAGTPTRRIDGQHG